MKFKFKSKEVEIKYKSTRIKYCYIWAGILVSLFFKIEDKVLKFDITVKQYEHEDFQLQLVVFTSRK